MTETDRHRAQQLLLRRSTGAVVERLWPALDYAALDETYPVLAARLRALVARNRSVSAGLAVGYVRRLRAAAGVRRDGFVPVPVIGAPAEQVDTALRVTSLVAVKRATERGDAPEVAMAAGLALTRGAVARLILNAGRETTVRAVADDPAASGWRRVLGGGGCDFCRERAGRRATSAVVFEAHDHCGCTVEPTY